MKSLIGGALVLAAGLAGCGSGGGSIPGSSTSPWLGTWNEGGTQSTTCGAVIETIDLGDVMFISAGTKSGTIRTAPSAFSVIWDVSGDGATLESGQSSNFIVFGTSATVTWTAGSLTLSGTTITGTLDGSADNGCSAIDQQITLAKAY